MKDLRATLGLLRSLIVDRRPGRPRGLKCLYAPFGGCVYDVGADDFGPFQRRQRARGSPFAFDEDFVDPREPPAENERVTQTVFGT